MGGGDLNLKKSWHPSTMRNMEKVWKAEQKHDQEKKRIAELQREIQEEKAREDMQKYAEDQGVIEKKSGDVKLDWMYKGPGSSVDHEEYLLGKAIDKSFEQLQRSQQQTSASICVPGRTDSTCLPGSIFAGTGEQVDVARKLQEDPLLAIRKKELQSRSEILKNPVKLKQLKLMMKTQKSKKSHGKHKKEKKKKKKSKKRSKHSSSSDDSDSDLDAKLLAKYQKLKQKLGDNALEALQKSPSSTEEKKKHKKRKSSISESEEEISSKKPHKSYGLLLPPGAKVKLSSKPSLEETLTKDDKSKAQTPQTPQVPRKQKLSDEEKERRRQEMLSNAAWREKERESNVARYREADRKEKSHTQKEFSDDFFRQQLSQAHAQSSVASRIKSNINNIQRSGGSMDKNFARR